MMEPTATTTILLPWDPESFAKVVNFLKAHGVEHRVVKSNERYAKIPTTKYYVHVRTEDQELIYRAMEGAACEIILPEPPQADPQPDSFDRWKPAIVFFILVVIFILTRLKS